MTTQRRNAMLAAGAVLLLLAAWFTTRPKPDRSLIGADIKASRIVYDGKPTPAAEVSLPFTRTDGRYVFANLAVDLNEDGKFAAYKTVGGATQEEWVVKNVRAKVVQEGNSYAFDIADPDVQTRNNFPLVAMLTEKPVKDWNGASQGKSAYAKTTLAAFTPEDFAPLFTADPTGAGAGGLVGIPGAVADVKGTPPPIFDRKAVKTKGNEAWLSDTTAGAEAGAGEAAAIGAMPAEDTPPAAGSDFEVFQPGVPDMSQGHNECVPTSISNGLSWLGDRYGFKDKLPATQLAAREEIKGDLGWTSEHGAGMGNNVINAKVAFSRRHGLPIVTHQIGGSFDDGILGKIAVELKKGQAVEVGIGYYTQDAHGAWTRHGGHMMSGVGAFGANGQTYLGVHDPLSPESGRLDIYPIDGSRIFNYRYRGDTSVFIEYAYAESPTAEWAAQHPPQTALDVNGLVEGKNLQDAWTIEMIRIGTAWFPIKQFHTSVGPECGPDAEHWHANVGTAWGLELKDSNYFDLNPERIFKRHAPVVEWKDPEQCGAGKTAEVERFNVMVSKDEASELLAKIAQTNP